LHISLLSFVIGICAQQPGCEIGGGEITAP